MSSGNIPGASNAHMIYVPVGVFGVICPLLVGTRLWSRLRKGGHLGPDDYVILFALAFALVSSAIMIASCYYGYGQHIANLSLPNKKEALKYFWVCQITYKACINLSKASILLLYSRIFNNVKWFKWSCYSLTVVVAMYCIASVVATIVQCDPIPRAWDKTIPGNRECISMAQFWYANAGFSISTDIIILLIPMPLVYSLQIPKVQKAALMVVFALGVFVVITSCLRITTIDIQATTTDNTYEISSTMWTIIEMNVAIVCACLPQMRPLLVKVFPKIMPSYSNGRSHGKTPYGSAFSASHKSRSDRTDKTDPEGRWARVEANKDAIHMTDIRKSDNNSEEYILGEDKSMQIQKTVGYSVEYSKDSREHV